MIACIQQRKWFTVGEFTGSQIDLFSKCIYFLIYQATSILPDRAIFYFPVGMSRIPFRIISKNIGFEV